MVFRLSFLCTSLLMLGCNGCGKDGSNTGTDSDDTTGPDTGTGSDTGTSSDTETSTDTLEVPTNG